MSTQVLEPQATTTAANMTEQTNLRNIAIIAHVDHGKTTLVDKILQHCRVFRDNEKVEERVLDSNDLERERGITILAKNIAVNYKGVKINLIDTPGHADFGGEVERVLQMADGVLLLVDAFEGPMPQTKFVLRKAIGHGLKPILVLNKIDRPQARPAEVLEQCYSLFIDLGAEDHDLEFPVVYASAKEGWASLEPDTVGTDVEPLLESMLSAIPAPRFEPGRTLQMLVSHIIYDNFVGRIAVGRVSNGTLRATQRVLLVKADGQQLQRTVKRTYVFDNLGRSECELVDTGDICALVGLDDVDIGDSVADVDTPEPLTPTKVDPPTLAMLFIATDSPFRGREGQFISNRQLKERLFKELRSNVALRVENTDDATSFKVSGRGLLHLGILIETMRREGFEFQISKPEVITQMVGEEVHEPIEECVVDVPSESMGSVIEILGNRRGEVVSVEQNGAISRIVLKVPARGLIGARTKVLNATRGEAVMHHQFSEFAAHKGTIPHRMNGSIITMAGGKANAYSINSIQDRGKLFVEPGDPVYIGQVIGEHCKDGDIVVNVTKTKQLTNFRASGTDKKALLAPPIRFTVEEALEWIAEDELVEVGPVSIRLRKKLLDEKARKRARNA